MCTNGVNHSQLKLLLDIAGEQTALSGGWLKEIAHLAGHAGVGTENIERAAQALKVARRALEDAADEVEAAPEIGGVEVSVV